MLICLFHLHNSWFYIFGCKEKAFFNLVPDVGIVIILEILFWDTAVKAQGLSAASLNVVNRILCQIFEREIESAFEMMSKLTFDNFDE